MYDKMSEKRKINTPPVIRVFLSSTFADMEHERSYFNEVLAPKLGRLCSDRGVSFFNVDLRWGITEEDQIGGQVLPICLGEIDKCRPYFIGIIGNRYGSLMETVPAHVAESIPWLEGKEGVSITELEMLYAVLDHEKEDPAINSAFYMRTDRLSRELYPDLVSENGAALGKLERLKSVIRSDGGVICSDYDTVEEFGECVMRDLVRWLDENFPESGDVGEIRREWYNGEILRGHIENGEMNAFLDSYIESSRRSLLIYGDGARGKTACLTAWEPKNAKKILINCASDEAYADWYAIAMRILGEMLGHLSDEDAKELGGILDGINNDCKGCVLGAAEREKFRGAVLACLRALEPRERVAVVINDLNLLSDEVGRLLSWLPAEGGERISFICSTNDGEMVENADVIGWNVKEMPLFSKESARDLLNNSLRVLGKNLAPSQFEALMSSSATGYPGQLRFVISFLQKHGRFNNLDRLAGDVAAIDKVHVIYRYVYDFLTAELSEREGAAAREVLGILRASDVALSENDCFTLAQNVGEISQIEWASICRIFEQFDLIHGDYWYIRDEESEKFVDELIPAEEMKSIHERLAAHIYAKLGDEMKNGKSANGRTTAAYAKQTVESLRAAKNYKGLKNILLDVKIIASLGDCEPSVLRCAWLELFLESDADVPAELAAAAEKFSKVSKSIAVDLCKMMHSLDMHDAHTKACAAIGVDPDKAVDEILWAHNLTDRGVEVYEKLHALKKKRQFRELSDTVGTLFESGVDQFNATELCKVYFFKADAEEHLGRYEDALSTANAYYTLALKAGYTEDMQTALQMRASALYRKGDVKESLSITRRIGKMAYSAGKTRDYLSSLNMTAMCCYRTEKFDRSVELFDKLTIYWSKLGEKNEVCSTILNKCNALHLSGQSEKALSAAEKFYASIKNERGMLSNIASFSGNMGIYASELGQHDKAEEYLLGAIEIAKMIGAESTLANAYTTLGKVYRATDSFKKGIDLYAEQMEFLWGRREYERVMEIYKKSFDWLSASNHKTRAIELEAEWKGRFSQIEGGLEYFEQGSEKHAADAVTVEKLFEQAKLAASAGDLRGEAEAHKSISNLLENDDPKLAAESLIYAATDYMYLDDRAARLEVLEAALVMLFKDGQIVDIPTYDTVVLLAEDEAFEAIARLWREIGDMAYAARMQEAGKMYVGDQNESLTAAVGDLLRMKEKNEYLAVCCIFDLAEFLVKTLSGDALLSLVSSISDAYKQDVIDRFDSVMTDEMNADLNYLMKNYFGDRADRLIARYEKYVGVLTELDGANAPALAGNLALIYRRRKEKEKAFRYHALSADLFRRAGKMDDCFIEIMNGATARKELSSDAEAVELLRAGLKEAVEKANRKFQAMIAGNLASTLMKDMKEDDRAEIESCFAIEERYFRSSGSWRDLVVSLVNQSIYYLKTGVPEARWRHKVKEARELATEARLGEFGTVLSRLEWQISQSERGEESSEESVKAGIASLLTENGYKLHGFEREDGYYYVVAVPEAEDKLYEEAIFAAVPFDKDFCLRVIAVIQPAHYKDEAEELDRYIEWWNRFDKYTLTRDKKNKQIKASENLHASDWKQLSERFGYFTSMWNADKMNCISLMTGIVDLAACQQAKLKTVE